jgi:hypothetical protein
VLDLTDDRTGGTLSEQRKMNDVVVGLATSTWLVGWLVGWLGSLPKTARLIATLENGVE